MVKETEVSDSTLKQLLDRMVGAKQLSSTDAATLARQSRPGAKPAVQSEDDILRWLAEEYDVTYATLDNIEPDRELLSLFPARVLLKEELLPLQRVNGTVEVATSRLFATQGL
ncbi:MAG TPA: type II/IV secretion system protein, partial [Verrucomicrobiae bacterium]|nr:type II/IV secretion system protein [Verrucomicrobiae bacterium]